MVVHGRLSKDNQGFKASRDDTVIRRPAWVHETLSQKKRKEERKSHIASLHNELRKRTQ